MELPTSSLPCLLLVIYNSLVLGRRFPFALCLCVSTAFWPLLFFAQQMPPPPPASGARILLLPRRIVAGERSTLAVLDVSGRLTPGATVLLSNGDRVTTNATGRALFVAPLMPGVLLGSLPGRAGHIPSTILTPTEAPEERLAVQSVPRFAALGDRFELAGGGFCGDADANRVAIAGWPALVLAASPASLIVLPPENLAPGPASVKVECGQRAAAAFSMTFVSLQLSAATTPLAAGERRTLLGRIRGTEERVTVEARNLAPDIAGLAGGTPLRVASSGGAENVARFEIAGRQRGSFLISFRLLSALVPPRP